jgi:hypothetical protein
VARAAGLLSVAALPLVAGLGGGSLMDPAALAPAYRVSMLVCAGLMLAGAAIAAVGIPSRAPARRGREEPPPPGRRPSPARFHCAVTGPPLHPRPAR